MQGGSNLDMLATALQDQWDADALEALAAE